MDTFKTWRIAKIFMPSTPWGVRFLYGLIRAKSKDEDLKRREFILNILLFSAIALLSIAVAVNAINFLFHDYAVYERNAISLKALLLILSGFSSLYFLSRKGFFIASAYLLISIYFFLSTYMAYRWGIDVQAGLLLYVLIIIMSGILINTRFSFIVAIISSFTIAVLNYFQRYDKFAADSSWKSRPVELSDAVMFSIIFIVIATVSWLSNREIEKSLRRARKSEAELKKERDCLEITVEKRTRELRETQLAEIAQLYRFAEFGRLSAGLFHDLMNPLSAVSLNMERVKMHDTDKSNITEAKKHLDKAILATRKMEDFVMAVRKQISYQESTKLFSLNKEIGEILDVLSHKIIKANVLVEFLSSKEVTIIGNDVKFNQIVLNLVSNAIDAYDNIDKNSGKKREIDIALKEEGEKIEFIVSDYGEGISEEKLSKIFDSFFTTKPSGKGMGIGLSMVKRIVEKDFLGVMEVESRVNEGTKFIIKFPKIKKNE
ncbi:MAG: hypothetical protein ACD_15C00113G0013 [uncultured bacterium]|nr:MAG: hypothetical protein ACD_15C00113G0013 [uncultured bacterium]